MEETLSGEWMRNTLFTIALCVGTFGCFPLRLAGQSAADSSLSRLAESSGETKSGTTATLLSAFLPGAGHVYAEDRPTGVVLMALFGAAVALGIGGENTTSGPLALLIAAGPWFYGVIDAHNAAARYNRAHASRGSGTRIQPAVVTGARGESLFGFAVQLSY
jgi:hypothetical protein